MPMQKVHWGAVIVAAIAFYAWGAVWFTLLKNPYMAAVGATSQQMGNAASTPFILSLIAALVLSLGTAIALADSSQAGAKHGIEFGAFMGIIVFATNYLSINAFEMKPFSLWLIQVGYVVIGMMIVGAIIGAWRKSPAAQSSK